MKEVVRAKCPSCQHLLTIPAEWAERALKCKRCGHQMWARRKPKEAVPLQGTPLIPAAVPMAPGAPRPAGPVTASPTWEPLPEYTPSSPVPMTVPGAVPAAGGDSTYVSAFGTGDKYAGRGRYKGPKGGGWVKYAVLTVLFLGLGGGGYALYHYRPDLFQFGKTDVAKEKEVKGTGVAENKGGTADPATGPFPRRMLAISAHSYLYANPVQNGESKFAADPAARTGTDAVVRKLADKWRVPNDQVFHLTDAPMLEDRAALKKKKGLDAPPPPPRAAKSLPLKMVMEGAITSFAETCREQDRAVLLFCGHAYEKDGKGYLLPIEGDFEELDTLIPVEWVFEKMAACKAQEKLVIFDVCRFHPDRGIERPHEGEMSAGLETALHSSPDGVSVLTSCSKGEYSYELDYHTHPGFKTELIGGFFLGMIPEASMQGILNQDGKIPTPADALPIERLAAFMAEKLPEVTKDKFGGKTQTPKLTLKRNETPVPYDAKAALAAKVAYPVPPPTADRKAVASILNEIEVPGVKAFRTDAAPTAVSDIVPFKQETLKEYEAGTLTADDTPNEFQKAVLKAVEEMRKLREAGSGNELPEQFVGETNDRAKEALKRVQEVPARVESIMKESLAELEEEAIASLRDKQTKRWQAHYDYVVAQLKFRICYANQYNLSLASVRGGKVPDLAGNQNGYLLTAEMALAKNTDKEYKTMFDEAKKGLSELVKNHPQTPWALLAKGDRTVAIGLRLTPAKVQ